MKTQGSVNARLRAKKNIDAAAATARGQHMTTAPGQDRVYRDKLAEAVYFLANGGAPPPYVAVEVEVTGMTATAAAQAIVDAAAVCRARDVEIERVRLAGKRDVDAAGEDVAAIVAAMSAALESIDETVTDLES